MFDIGWTELAIIALIALLVIGPKDLPQAMRTISSWVKRIRGMAREFQSGVDDMIREAELDGIKEEFGAVAGTDLDAMVENTIDPDGTFADEFDLGGDFVPPDDTSPAPGAKKKRSKAKTGTKRAAKTGAKTKRAAAASPAGKSTAAKPRAKKPATKRAPAKRAPAKRTVAKKAPAKSPSGSSTRKPTGSKARS